jgi:glutamate-1-semialdehyde 2,1-aminomutase
VLIFDECTSGFRETFGGLHKKYGVEPDMAMFGKALGNGYAITAVIGRKSIMEAAQSTFISSTFWTERIGPAAALKTLEVMEKERSWERITSVGKTITCRWLDMAKRHGLHLKTFGLSALASFSFSSAHHQAYRTLITQEMLKQGYLAAASVYVCLAHTSVLRDRYFQILDGVFAKIAACEGGLDPRLLLHGPLAETGFWRLN